MAQTCPVLSNYLRWISCRVFEALNDWVLSVEGNEAGKRWALILALVSAAAHAAFGAIQKWRDADPWIIRGCIDIWFLIIATPLAVFVFPAPEWALVPILIGVFLIHAAYKLLLAAAYARGAFTVVYPVVRGIGPLATVILAYFVFAETLRLGQWGGVALISASIMALAAVNLRGVTLGREQLLGALGFAVLTGVMVAIYTTYDAWGIRLAENAFTFLIWFFVTDGLLFPLISYRRWRAMDDPPAPGPLLFRGLIAACVAFVSFGAVMLATRLDNVGEAAALRETSVLFAAIFGWLFLKEKVGPIRGGLMVLIALGAVLVEFG